MAKAETGRQKCGEAASGGVGWPLFFSADRQLPASAFHGEKAGHPQRFAQARVGGPTRRRRGFGQADGTGLGCASDEARYTYRAPRDTGVAASPTRKSGVQWSSVLPLRVDGSELLLTSAETVGAA